jgi:hypothetical protein
MTNLKHLFDYVTTQEEVIITYIESVMVLSVHSNAGYCYKKKAQSQAGGHFYESNHNPTPPNNRAILTVATIIKKCVVVGYGGRIRGLVHQRKGDSLLRTDPP